MWLLWRWSGQGSILEVACLRSVCQFSRIFRENFENLKISMSPTSHKVTSFQFWDPEVRFGDLIQFTPWFLQGWQCQKGYQFGRSDFPNPLLVLP